MKIALVHDYLNQYGGAERVLETLIEMFPDAPVYTLLYDTQKTGKRFEGKIKKTSFLDTPFVRNHHRLFLPFMPLAAQSIDLGDTHDVIISDTAGYGKGISYNPKTTKHISYCHTPLRYAWETHGYVTTKFGRVLGPAVTAAVSPVAWYLRRWDHKMGQRPDVLLSNSRFIAEKIKKHYGRDSEVVYPPVDSGKFYWDGSESTENYYLATGRLLHYKRFDLIVDAFKKLRRPLLIVGSGPEEQGLKDRARGTANIHFVPFVDSEDELRKLYHNAKALIFTHTEDFGLVPAEAQACGTPVIAYADGGALEIIDDDSGVLFNDQSVGALIDVIHRFEKRAFSRNAVSQRSDRFSKSRFQEAIRSLL